MAELVPQIDLSLGRAIAFLKQAQLPHGEFAAVVATDPDIRDGVPGSSPFFTTFVLYALQQVKHVPAVPGMIDRAVRFLEEQKQAGGLWRYYSSRQSRHCDLPPDLDDTACVTFALRQAGWRAPANEWAFTRARDEAGRFVTYFLPNCNIRMSVVLALGQFQARCYRRMACYLSSAGDQHRERTEALSVPVDEVDPIVNANVILLLGERETTRHAIEYMVRVVPEARDGEYSLYYHDTLVLSYMVARAFLQSAPSLGVLKDAILSDVQTRAQSGSLFGSALPAAMAASILITFDSNGLLLDALIDCILRLQEEDGSWKQQSFYSGPAGYWWGSRELTTAFCVEALARYVGISQVHGHGQALVAPEGRWNPDGVLTGPEGVDAEWYLARYPQAATCVSAAAHYAYRGWCEGNDPNPDFSTTGYLKANPDVAAARINPLAHYLTEGRREGRAFVAPQTAQAAGDVLTGPEGVDAEWYLARYPEAAAYLSPAEHYARAGWREGKDPNPTFFTTGYFRANPDVAAAQINPLVHYLTWGRQEGRAFLEPDEVWNPEGVLTGPEGVDAEWYLARYPETAGLVSAAAHYAHAGWRDGKDPNPEFSTGWYLRAYPDIAAAGINPLVHYLMHGRSEGRTRAPSGAKAPPTADIMRAKNWWPGKITPALAIAFATALGLDVPVISVAPVIVSMIVGLAACAAYVSLINDLSDTKEDELSRKPNATRGRSRLLVIAVLVGCIAVGLGCCLLWWPDYPSIALYLASWISFALYSLRPIRLKERALPGAVADAAGAHVFPALLATTLVFHAQGIRVALAWAVLVATWSFCYGLRSIVEHQLIDEPNDARAGVNTYVRRVGIFRAVLNSEYLWRPVELFCVAFILMSTGSVVVLCSAVIYGMLAYARHQFRTRPAYHRSFAALSGYYVLVLPLALLAASAIADPVDLVSAAVFILVFYKHLKDGVVQAYGELKAALFPDHPTVRLSARL